MNMTAIAMVIGAGVAGLLLGWLFGRSSVQGDRLDLEKRAASQQGASEELKKQCDGLQHDVRALQGRVEEEQKRRATAERDAQAQRDNLAEQRRLLDEVQQRFKEAFQALANEALKDSSRQFLDLANERLGSLQKESQGDLELRSEAIRGMIDPLQTAVKELRSEVNLIEAARMQAYGRLHSEVENLASASKDLRQETGTLVNSLKQPQVKGRWGELTLRRAVELAGMSPHCDFVEQFSMETGEGRLRPDLIVYLTGGTRIVVDAKVPLDAFMRAQDAANDSEYQSAMKEHARLMRNHVSQLSGKEYWKQFDHAPEFVVMFIPGESFFSAALGQDRSLMEDAIQDKVVLASPTTLIVLLRSIAYGWRQHDLAQNAEKIRDLAEQLYDRFVTFSCHLAEMARGLERANRAYNSAVASFDGRLLPAVRKFKEMGASGRDDVPELESIDIAPRQPLLSAPDPEL